MARSTRWFGLGSLVLAAACGSNINPTPGPGDGTEQDGDDATVRDGGGPLPGDGLPGDGQPGDGQPGDGQPGDGDGSSDEDGGPDLPPACQGQTRPAVSGPLPSFAQEEISSLVGSAYMLPADLNGDAYPEFLLTTLSEGIDITQIGGGIPLANGGAYVLAREGGAPTGSLGSWSTTKVFDKAAGIGFPNSSELFDIDGDQIDDWVVAAGFLIKPTGKIVWMKGDGQGGFGAPTPIAVPDAACWYHIALGLDMDGDGDQDFVSTCHVGTTSNVNGPSRVEWFENRGEGEFANHAIGAGGGSLLALHDLDADGDLDIVAPQFFGPEALVWFEQTGAQGASFVKHVINDSTGRGFSVKFADMNGDGKLDLLYGNHNNQQADAAKNQVMGLYWFEIPAPGEIHTLASWDAHLHVIHEGFMVAPATGPFAMNNKDSAGAPGMINVGDIDGDCDLDVTASGDGDEGLYVFVQQADGFEQVELSHDPKNQNSGEQHMVDLDGDGDMDVLWAVFGPQGISLSSHVYAFLQD